MATHDVEYIAQLVGVREMALAATARAEHGLEPIEKEGRVGVVLTGLDSRWLAFPFRDISVVVSARVASAPSETG